MGRRWEDELVDRHRQEVDRVEGCLVSLMVLGLLVSCVVSIAFLLS